MKLRIYQLLSIALFLVLTIACQKKAIEDLKDTEETDENATTYHFESGDIIVTNNGTKSVLLFDSKGKYKKNLYTLSATSGFTPQNVYYNVNMETLMIMIDGSTDKVVSIKKSDGSINENFILDANFTSATANTAKAIAQLTTGDIILGELSSLERFSYSGVRITSDSVSGVWPKTGGTVLTTVITQMAALSSGGLLACSSGSDVIRAYNNTLTQIGNAVSGIAATTDVTGCAVDTSGGIYAAFNGTTDTIRKYSNTALTTTAWSYSNTSILPNPVGIAVSSTGTVLAVDATNNWVIEVTADGTSGSPLGGSGSDINSLLSTPISIYVIP